MAGPTLPELTRVFARIGMLSFGGPAAQIGLMHRELVETRNWLDEDRFLRALSFCMLLPGPEAMQLATYAGWRLKGTTGGLVAGSLFVIPGALIVLVLAAAYARWGDVPLVQSLFLGVQATVVVVVLQALARLGRKALKTPARWALAGLSFGALYALTLPFPLIIALAAGYGYLTAQGAPVPRTAGVPHRGNTGRTALTWAGLWLGPVAALWLFADGILAQIALFFSKLAILTFGGAYAVLAWMAQEVVAQKGWLTPDQMIDALGLAETTPGPLILVTQFVGFLAGHQAGGLWLAVAAALVTLWVTFVPCFLWIFTGAPFIDRLAGFPRLSAALDAVTAAVVGVILNLSLWFAAHVAFGELTTVTAGIFHLTVPVWSSFEPQAAILAGLAAVLLVGLRWPLPVVLILMAAAGVAL
ncbi:chromate efflux transporter [Rhodovulum sp. P5]|uniref:chromate efflux transporter n=1 Tax=Rhodovulum sp. P5 TaxID=1564506 RepID=UPI0009DB0380|nr:chromate efflux transporter [Rhodovulum sp. P5]